MIRLLETGGENDGGDGGRRAWESRGCPDFLAVQNGAPLKAFEQEAIFCSSSRGRRTSYLLSEKR